VVRIGNDFEILKNKIKIKKAPKQQQLLNDGEAKIRGGFDLNMEEHRSCRA
jgi:hypothetical protein